MSQHFNIKNRQLVTVINITKCPIDHSKFIWLFLSKCFPLRSGNGTICWMFCCLGHPVLLGVGEVLLWDDWSRNPLIGGAICLHWQCTELVFFFSLISYRNWTHGVFLWFLFPLPPLNNLKKIWLLLMQVRRKRSQTSCWSSMWRSSTGSATLLCAWPRPGWVMVEALCWQDERWEEQKELGCSTGSCDAHQALKRGE